MITSSLKKKKERKKDGIDHNDRWRGFKKDSLKAS